MACVSAGHSQQILGKSLLPSNFNGLTGAICFLSGKGTSGRGGGVWGRESVRYDICHEPLTALGCHCSVVSASSPRGKTATAPKPLQAAPCLCIRPHLGPLTARSQFPLSLHASYQNARASHAPQPGAVPFMQQRLLDW